MEAGDPSVSVDLLIRSLFALGVNRVIFPAKPATERRIMAFANRTVVLGLTVTLLLTLGSLGCGSDSSAAGEPFVPAASR